MRKVFGPCGSPETVKGREVTIGEIASLAGTPSGVDTPISWNAALAEVRPCAVIGIDRDGREKVNFNEQATRAEVIACLNDDLRKNGRGGRMVITPGVHSLASFDARELIGAVAAYDRFDPDNDPHGERDFGTFELFGVRLMWKIDYFDLKLELGSDDPADPAATVRVLTVLLPSEY